MKYLIILMLFMGCSQKQEKLPEEKPDRIPKFAKSQKVQFKNDGFYRLVCTNDAVIASYFSHPDYVSYKIYPTRKTEDCPSVLFINEEEIKEEKMSEGYFTVSSKVKLADLEVGTRINESDFASLTPDGTFVQLKYVEEESKAEPFNVKPGKWVIKKSPLGMFLQETSFVKDRLLEDFVETKHVEEKVDMFFSKLNVYKELGIEIPKRSALLYGPAGTGKTSLINKLCDKYTKDNETAVIVWHTDVFEPHEVKSFIQSFEYEKHGVKKMILVVEDLGGTEVENARVRSDSSLLSLLDNKEKTFTLPVFILATTNFPQMFLGNIANRPERFDDKIKIGYPPGEARLALLKFFSKIEVSEETALIIQSNKCKEFSPAHVREIVVRSMIYDKTQMQVIDELIKEAKAYDKGFADNGGEVGFRG